ncbi:hypothetical protein MHYP_G00112800 [Metynnis hypsauchen]
MEESHVYAQLASWPAVWQQTKFLFCAPNERHKLLSPATARSLLRSIHHNVPLPSLRRAVLCEADRATPLLHSSSLSAPTKLCRRPYNEISYFFSRFGAIFDWTGGTLFTSTKKFKQSEACLKGKASQLPSAAPSAPYRGRSHFTQVFKVR